MGAVSQTVPHPPRQLAGGAAGHGQGACPGGEGQGRGKSEHSMSEQVAVEQCAANPSLHVCCSNPHCVHATCLATALLASLPVSTQDIFQAQLSVLLPQRMVLRKQQ